MGRRIRPYPLALAVLIAAALAFLLLMMVAARRRDDPAIGWVAAAFEVLFLPAAAWYRSEISIEEEGLRLKAFQSEVFIAYPDLAGYGLRTSFGDLYGSTRWLTVMSKDGRRIDAAIAFIPAADRAALLDVLAARAPRLAVSAPSSARLGLLSAGTAAAILASFFVMGVFIPRTLGERGLLDGAAAAGLACGLLSGLAVGKRLLPASPAGGLAAWTLALMAAVPAAASAVNFLGLEQPLRDAPMTVVSRDAADRRVALVVDGIPKRLSLTEGEWDRLPQSGRLSACTAIGRLGYPVVLGLGEGCAIRRSGR